MSTAQTMSPKAGAGGWPPASGTGSHDAYAPASSAKPPPVPPAPSPVVPPVALPAREDESFPPRGTGEPGREETQAAEMWAGAEQLGASWDWKPGAWMLGGAVDRLIGRDDDRHVVILAGSRAGKTSTLLIPNLRHYPGSALVVDPKGELARATAHIRHQMGQAVFILDPFGVSGFKSNHHNPLSELLFGVNHIAAEAAQLADALILKTGGDTHWTDSAKNLVKGLALHLLETKQDKATLRDLRRLLNGTPAELERALAAMVASTMFDGVLRNIGTSFLGKLAAGGRELQGILSTAQEQTAPLDDIVGVTDQSDFVLENLSQRPTTIYLVLPGMRMGTHYRWLRLVIQQALAAMERRPAKPGTLPVWFMLEEFAALAHMRPVETAAGFMAGFGVKLICVLQDLTQLQTHYRTSWETFLGNAGFIQAFGNADQTTTEYLSRRIGTTPIVEVNGTHVSSDSMKRGDLGRRETIRSVRLMEAFEITRHFARETGRQLVLSPGRPPIHLMRLERGA